MNRVLFLFPLVAAFLFACQADEDDAPFVTDAVISPAATVAPGDEVTVTAQGFQSDDQIMFRVTWPLAGEVMKEGYADGVWGVVTARSEQSITFLALGRYPAGMLEVKLFRGGKAMSLGRIPISDGQSPAEYSLYGVADYETDGTGIFRIDRTTGESTLLKTLGTGQYLSCVVNDRGTNSIYGVSTLGNIGTAVCYDLTMRYYRRSESEHILAAGTLGNVIGYVQYDASKLLVSTLDTRMSIQQPLSWQMPEGITAAMLGEYPFTMSSHYILLSAHTAAGTFRACVLSLAKPGVRGLLGEEVEADAMVPFRMLVRSEDPGVGVVWVGGYAVAQAGTTFLHLFNPITMSLEEAVAEVPGTARSITVMPVGEDAVKIFLLCEENGVRRIRIYDTSTKQLTVLPGEVTCSEIVLAK